MQSKHTWTKVTKNNYKEKIIEGTCIAKKGVVKLSDAWVKTIGL